MEPSPSGRQSGLNTKLMRKAVQERALGIPAADVALGRFVVLEPLGRGGMGEVFAAYDSNLDRRVAVKVLRGVGPDPDDTRQRRLEREARAMAKLSHPNVLTVHEVGVHDGRVFLVMEYVEGGSLLQWCENNPPSEGERFETALQFMRDVGSGLIAAHDAGLIHRDLKPHNVLLQPTPSGAPRAVVGDFGLARAGSSATSAGHSSRRGGTPNESDLTQTGAAVGTPAYMAPEQFEGRADERSDQYGLCATFYEVFHGMRYRSDGEPVVVVPRRLQRVLDRGMAEAPADRFSSVRALLAELERDPPRRWPLVVGGVAVTGGATAAAIWSASRVEPATVAPCDDGSALLEPVLGTDRKAAIRTAFAATAEPYWSGAWERTEGRLDAYGAQWRAAYLDACEATVIRRVQTPEMLEQRTTCLEQLLEALELTTSAFAEATPELVANAYTVSLALPPPAECADTEQVRPQGGLSLSDPSVAAATAALRRAAAQLRLANVREAEVEAAEAARRAHDIGSSGLQADAALLQSQLASQAGDWARAETSGLEALALSEQTANAERMAAAWEQLSNVANDRNMGAEAVFRAERAGSLAEGARLDPAIRGEILATHATALASRAPVDKVIAMREQALTLLRQGGMMESHARAVSIDLAGDLAIAGKPEEALALGREILAEMDEVYPQGHPTPIVVLGQLAQILHQAGEQEEALSLVDRALSSFPGDPRWHVERRLALTGLRASILVQSLRLDEATSVLEEQVRDGSRFVPAEHPEIRGALMQLAAVALERGDPKAALAQLRALGNYGDDERVHPFNRAAYWGNRAEARVRTGDVSGGLVDLERARELYATDGGHSTWMFLFMVHAARTLELAGKRKRSIHGYERALALAERVEVDPTELADAWFGLARALADRDPARARRLAEGARDRYAVLGAAGEAKLLEIETWLATVP